MKETVAYTMALLAIPVYLVAYGIGVLVETTRRAYGNGVDLVKYHGPL